MREEEFREALKASLSGVQFDEARRRAVLEPEKGETVVKRKIKWAAVVMAAMILLGGTALAAGLGLFGQFAEDRNEAGGMKLSAEALEKLEAQAVSCELQQTVQVGQNEITMTIHQSYCDGSYLYISYSLPRGYKLSEPYSDTGHEMINLTAENVNAVYPTAEQFQIPVTSIHLPYRAGDVWTQGDTWTGYQMLVISPYVKVGQTIDVRFSLNGPGGLGYAVFTLPVNGGYARMVGSAVFEAYEASAVLLISDVLAQGQVTLNREDWGRRRMGVPGDDDSDYVYTYQLVADGAVQWTQIFYTGTFSIPLRYDRPPEGASLALRPVYAQAGPCPEEDIPLTIQ